MNEDMWTDTTPQDERQSWSRLIGDHDRIAAHCAAIVALTRRSDTYCAEASRRIFELAVIIADHLGVEDEVADLTAAAMEADYSDGAIAAMQADLDAMQDDLKTFIARWLPAIDPADWDNFATDAANVLPRLAVLVRRENRVLYAKALRYGVISRGAVVLH